MATTIPQFFSPIPNHSFKSSHPLQFPLKTLTSKPPNRLSISCEARNGLKDPLGDDASKERRPAFIFRWQDLLNNDPENLVAVGLAGILAWASAQVLFQLFVISIAILLAALKYSLIAALLLFILITLL